MAEKRNSRNALSLTPTEEQLISSHPDFDGSIPSTVRTLALLACGGERPDPYAAHKERLKGPDGKLLPAGAASLARLFSDAFAAWYAEGFIKTRQDFNRIYRGMVSAKSRERLTEVLFPVLQHAGEGAGEIGSLLAEDWELARQLAILANSGSSYAALNPR